MAFDARHLVTAAVVFCTVQLALAQCPTFCDCTQYQSKKEIRCASQRLTSIPTNFPADTQVLRLEYNNVTSIGPNDLVLLVSLKRLVLYNNQISFIDANAFRSQGNLEYLALENNKLATIDPWTFRDMSRITKLKLNNNRLKTFSNGTFQGLAKLLVLTLPGNPLEVLPPRIFSDLSNLETLDLSNVNFQAIPEALFDGLSSLRTLKMDNVTVNGDVLFTGENLFSSISNLTTLQVQMNSLTCIPSSFSTLTTLETLVISKNPLTCNDLDVLQNLPALTQLQMEFTQMTRLRARMFAGNANLQFLYVSSSAIAEIEQNAFIGLTQLEDLLLYSNNLTSLPNDVFSPLPTDVELDIGDNPFHCDCNLRWFRQWLVSVHQGNIPDSYQPRCDSPIHLSNRQLISIDNSDFACMPKSVASTTSHTVTEEDDLNMDCAITGDPAPDLHWLTPNHIELQPGTSLSPFSVSVDGVLTIIRIKQQDAGTYSCVGTNSAGTLSVRNDVTVISTEERRSTTTMTNTTETEVMTTPQFLPLNNPKMDLSVTIIIGVVCFVSIVVIAGILLYCRRVNRKRSMEHEDSAGMVFQNGPIATGGNCNMVCSNNFLRAPLQPDARYAASNCMLPGLPGMPPSDFPPPYSSCSRENDDGIYDQIRETIGDTYETPLRHEEQCAASRLPSQLGHTYMSKLERQDSRVSQGSCGAPAGYERSFFNSRPTNNLYSSEPASPPTGCQQIPSEGHVPMTVQEVGYVTSLPPKGRSTQKKIPQAVDQGIELHVKGEYDESKATYQNARRK